MAKLTRDRHGTIGLRVNRAVSSAQTRRLGLALLIVGTVACAQTPTHQAAAIAGTTCVPPYPVGSATLSLSDVERQNRVVSMLVHYPASSAGSGTPAVAGCAAGLVAFGHGFAIANGAYGYLADALAAQGYVVVLPGTESGLSPDHAAFGADLAFSLRALPGAPAFAGVFGPLRVIGGHSMGGGAAFLGATAVDGLFALAPAQTTPSAIAAAATISVPALLITGSRDCVTPLDAHAGPMFAALETPVNAKTLANLSGASHCQFTTGSVTCSLGELSCGGSATITASDQQTATLSLLLPWLASLAATTDRLYAQGFEN